MSTKSWWGWFRLDEHIGVWYLLKEDFEKKKIVFGGSFWDLLKMANIGLIGLGSKFGHPYKRCGAHSAPYDMVASLFL